MLGLLTRTGLALAIGLFVLAGALRSAFAGEWLDTVLATVLGGACVWAGLRASARARARLRAWRGAPVAE
ncbi:MAG TPA: hypothetical protein VHQ45_12320 [Gemmatimonadaceae bacterium]|jgi:hypothetical protein|nr:hypothetical protein [Gemmatimonadaceae bacterium]